MAAKRKPAKQKGGAPPPGSDEALRSWDRQPGEAASAWAARLEAIDSAALGSDRERIAHGMKLGAARSAVHREAKTAKIRAGIDPTARQGCTSPPTREDRQAAYQRRKARREAERQRVFAEERERQRRQREKELDDLIAQMDRLAKSFGRAAGFAPPPPAPGQRIRNAVARWHSDTDLQRDLGRINKSPEAKKATDDAYRQLNDLLAPVLNSGGDLRQQVKDVVSAWQRKLIRQHHPDRGGSTVAMGAVNEAAGRLSKALENLE